MPRVDVPGLGVVEFPDDMSREQIEGVIRRTLREQQGGAAPAATAPAQPAARRPGTDVHLEIGGPDRIVDPMDVQLFQAAQGTPTAIGLSERVGIAPPAEPAPLSERAVELGRAAGFTLPKLLPPRVRFPAGRTAEAPPSPPVAVPEAAGVAEAGQALPRKGATSLLLPRRPMMTASEALETERQVTSALPAEMQGVRLSTETTKKVADAAGDFFARTGTPRDPDLPVTLQVVKALEESPDAFPALMQSLERSGVTLPQFSEAFIATGSSAGRQLSQLANVSRRMERIPGLRELSDEIDRARRVSGDPLTGWDLVGHFFDRFVNLWRGSLVTAWSTAVRNLETQVARVGIAGIEETLDTAVRNIFRLGTAEDRALGPAFRRTAEMFHSLGSRGRQRQARAILDAFPEESGRLFNRFASDVAVSTAGEGRMGRVAQMGERAFNAAERGVNFANVVNRAQEFIIRRAAFRAKLADTLRRKGQDIARIDPRQIDPADINSAIDHALEMTFALSPKNGPARWLMQMYEVPVLGKGLSFVAPFPRFMANAWRFQFQYSPAGFLQALSPKEMRAIAAGDVKTLSRATIGTGLLYAAWEIRNNPDLAGERWYELKAGDRRIDMRPFAPFSSYLFVAELAKRVNEGRPLQEIRDVIQGVAASQFRAGAGLYMLDIASNTIDAALRSPQMIVDELEKPTRPARRFAGEVVGGFLQPLTTLRELFVDYGRFLGDEAGRIAEEEGKLRDVREEPFLGPVKRRIPGASQTLPERELPLRAETPRQEAVEPGGVRLSRQLTGLSPQTRTPIEAEANRLGLTFAEVNPRTGEPKADRLIAREMAPIAERVLPRMLALPAYQQGTDAEKRVRWAVALRGIRSAAFRLAAKEDRKLFARIQVRRSVGRRERELLEERGALPQDLLR